MYEVYYLDKNEEFQKTTEHENIESPLILKNCQVSLKKKKKVVKKNIYEGGYTIWECTWEMLRFFYKEEIDFKNMNILELGCAHGLVGINALQNKASVVFQELNKRVIDDVLLPNISKNLDIKLKKNKLKKKYMKINEKDIKCFVINKPWNKLNKKLRTKELKPFDYIIGNEILYRKENYYSIVKIIKLNLKPNGKAYFGAKSYYFGFEDGAGSISFLDYINNNKDLNLVAKIVHTSTGKSIYSKDVIEISFLNKE
ncbi:conserved Plasmodium protein, unknown function [Plasmodium berghei]|uniref:protein-histidine N-methyltransferase n=2 Tax=Plasmodium berghei TaxID=5821 RepID=A0A509AIP6_PLABA|nr:methyltransferase, putative [Plasmodium berghei ANKA]CXI08305.1 conserved Plasmodium protein, unknown function [Plasmodium berghei]SCL92709.1 conserved Plasmodium protein, unknown function [Plasmodium berghei]SCM15699.1 conserved Plasmodium protein, unknown function [Plasmodium berghei]SCM17493.1 conserved Plasmodium protein, unknown function [Plasmodium berghei]SCN22885.1 conserved Plasmodium protein, unknown function [Plasmodium berghei]|eukprot:XP_034420304.1 methyltransferase, putative [Plasmodium berghei ANKA]